MSWRSIRLGNSPTVAVSAPDPRHAEFRLQTSLWHRCDHWLRDLLIEYYRTLSSRILVLRSKALISHASPKPCSPLCIL